MKLKTCLLVEDDREDQAFFMDTLSQVDSNVSCYAVSNGLEALVTLSQKDFTPDVIFTDLNMPKMNGLEFIKAMRQYDKFRDIPVIVYSTAIREMKIDSVDGVTASYPKSSMETLRKILMKYFSQSGKKTPRP
jgi:CheY-like chemotaxis protein